MKTLLSSFERVREALLATATFEGESSGTQSKGGKSSGKIWLFLMPALLFVVFLFAYHTYRSSLVIDGVRWFWLDDDQMISMRYARNLARGVGLVYNPGEHVEGYTNFGWTLIMAAVHLLPLSDQLMPVALSVVSCVVCMIVVVLAAQLIQKLERRWLMLTLPAMLVCLVCCSNVMFWATSGFETTLVTALHLWVVVRVLGDKGLDYKVLVPLALIPIVRGDSFNVWIGDATLICLLSANKKRALAGLAISLLPFVFHLIFRLSYYGDLLPNTYYLKVAGLDGRLARGYSYVSRFARSYWLPLIFAGGTLLGSWREDRRTRSLLTSIVPPVLYSLQVGGDSFAPYRFFGHVMPELFVWAALGGARLVSLLPARLCWVLALVGFAVPSAKEPLIQIAAIGGNGDPFDQIVVAAQLRKNAAPDSSIAVIPAGIVPYYTHLFAIDVLGKTDRHVAHLTPVPGAYIGHGKLDPKYSLARKPDYVISCRARHFVAQMQRKKEETPTDYVRTFLAAPEFIREWYPNPIRDPFLLKRTAVYLRSDSKEQDKRSNWQSVVVSESKDWF